MAVPFDELLGSPTGSYTEDGKRLVTRKGWTDWADIDAFFEELIPPPIVTGDGIFQQLPASLPGNPLMFVQKVDFEPYGQMTGVDANGIAAYEKAQWTINYGVPKYDTKNNEDPVVYLNHEWTVGGEVLTLEAASLAWQNAPTTVNSSMRAGLVIPTFETQLNWERVISPPFASMRSCIGCVNNADITFDTGTCAKETLLFLGAKLSRQIMSDGSRAWKVGYQFSEKISPRQLINATDKVNYPSGGWNFFLDPTPPSTFRRMLAGGQPIYAAADFQTLFKAG